MTRTFMAALASFVILLGFGMQSTAAQGDLDCADFSSQEAAQAHLNANPSDPDNLDADDDGYACETYFGYIGNPVVSQPDIDDGSSSPVTELPATGSGSTVDTPLTSAVLVVLALVVGVVSMGIRLRTR